jgi:hypothetical protein
MWQTQNAKDILAGCYAESQEQILHLDQKASAMDKQLELISAERTRLQEQLLATTNRLVSAGALKCRG